MVCCGRTCSGFRDFILRGNVVDIAVGIVVGTAFKELVDRFVENLVTPLIGVFGGTPDFSDNQFTVRKSVFKYGLVVNAFISFLIISLVVYFMVVIPVQAFINKVKPPPPPEVPCMHCKMLRPPQASRCGHCGMELPEEGPVKGAVSLRGNSSL